MNKYMQKRNEKGFTLIELLIAIVVVGILAAVAIVGIAGLTNTGSKSACTASLDSATAASAAYYANQTPNAWQANLTALIAANPPVFVPPAGYVMTTANEMTVGTWHLTETGGGTTAPTFACS